MNTVGSWPEEKGSTSTSGTGQEGDPEKNHVGPPSSQDVALCRYSVSGEVPL